MNYFDYPLSKVELNGSVRMKSLPLEWVDTGREESLVPRAIADGAFGTTRGPRVFVIHDGHAKKVRAHLSGVVDKQPKNAATQPTRVFGSLKPGQCGILRRAYTSPGQLQRSLRTLLRNLRDRELNVACMILIPDELFSKLLERVDDSDVEARSSRPQSHAARMIAVVTDSLRDDTMPDFLREEYVGDAESIERVRQVIWRVSKYPDPVVITGESGTGKEIIARCIHKCSVLRGRGRIFNPINCGAVQAQLFESELFGHAKHSFTDAREERIGLWQAAGNGTLFLDEIADLEPSNQAKMLRALESGKVRPVGSNSEVDVSARIVSATNRDLHSMTLYGTFRRDLYYRINTFRIVAPPLRDHIEDIGTIAQFLWKKVNGEGRPPLPEAVISVFAERSWPGNVRELHNVITMLRSLSKGAVTSRIQAEAAIFSCDNPAAIFSHGGTQEMSTNARRAATIRQLKGAHSALDDAQNFFDMPGGVRGMVRNQNAALLGALDDRRRELEDLTGAPLLMGSAECFDAVHEAAGKIAYLLDSLHTDAVDFTARELRDSQKSIEHARELVLAQIEKTLASVRS